MKLSRKVFKEIHGTSRRGLRKRVFYELNFIGLSNSEKEMLYRLRLKENVY